MTGARRAPASVGQASLWFLRQWMPYKSAYNTSVRFRLEGTLDAAALEAAVREVVRRHESLRTTFAVAEGTVSQVIHEALDADVRTLDVSGTPDPEASAEHLARTAAAEPFDLERGPLFRARIVRTAPVEHALCVIMDHIVADGMSLGILWREIEAVYEALRVGAPPAIPAPPKQYAACAEEQDRWLATPAFARQLRYWTEHLRGAVPCDLPADRPRPNVRSFRGDLVIAHLSPSLTAGLRALAEREEVSLFAVLLAVLFVLIARSTGQRDVSVMIPVACRQRFGAEHVVGFFANMVVLRADVPDRLPFRALLQRVSKEITAGLFRQDVPFEKVIEALNPHRSLSHDPVTSVALSFLPEHGGRLDLPGVRATYGEIPTGGSKFDLHLVASEHGGDVMCSAEHNGDIFERTTIEGLLDRFRRLLASAVEAPDRATGDLDWLSLDEVSRIVRAWNETAAPSARGATVRSLVAATAARAPEALAVSFEGDAIDRGTLQRRSRRVARALQARGARPGVRVGIAVERSVAMVVGLLGILEAGSTYLPLDPSFPGARLAFMAEDAGIHILVTEDRLAGLVSAPGGGVLSLDGDAVEIEAMSAGPLDVDVDPESIAYVLYTSGSTGRPKGVEVPHRAVVNFLTAMAARPGLGEDDRILAVTSLSFDIAGLEIWLPLAVGAQVEIASRETAGDGAALRRHLDSGRITVMQATPATFRLLLEAGWQGRHPVRLLVGGEAVPPDLADRLAERSPSVWNMYGPTETTIWSCVHELSKGAPVLVGRPIANTRTYVLDRGLYPVPPGVTGELYIGGDGVTRGYLGRPDLTAERFVPDPFSSSGGRLYRTGDLARQRRDGSIEILGRVDFQVKIRGYRIELGEIEAVLGRHPGVREAVVAVREDTPSDPRLVAYVTAAGEVAPGAAELRAHVRAELPEHMVPASLMVLERLPLTANNKIDRRALPRPMGATPSGDERPREALELKLRAIWEEVLRAPHVGMGDSFFDLGGHSLLALQLFDRIERALGLKLPVTALFQAPTIEKLGELLRREGWQPSWSSLVAIQTAGTRPPFFCVHAVGGNVLNYRLLSSYLGAEQPFYGLQSRGLGGNEAPHETVEQMAAAYIAEVRTAQARGPYVLGGSSSGGVIAYEMAQQLHAMGEEVAVLVMLDTTLAGALHPPLARALARHHRGMMFDYHLGHLLLRSSREGLRYLVSRVEARLRGTSAPVVEAVKAAPEAVRHVFEANLRALERYVPRPYPGRAVMLLSRDEPGRTFYDERLAWAELVQGGLTVRFIPGDHQNLLDEPQVSGVAQVLARCLDGA